MDAPAQRIIKSARDTLVDGLDFLTIVSATATAKERAEAVGHGCKSRSKTAAPERLKT